MIGNVSQHRSQVCFGIDPVQFGRSEQAVDLSGAFPASIRTREQIILAPERDRAQRPLGSVVACRNSTKWRRSGTWSPFELASVDFALGQTDEGFEWLAKAFQDRGLGTRSERCSS